LYRKMKKRSDIRWSEVARRAIAEQLDRLEGPMGLERPMVEVRRILAQAGVNPEAVPIEKAIRHYRKVRRLDWKRASSTRAN